VAPRARPLQTTILPERPVVRAPRSLRSREELLSHDPATTYLESRPSLRESRGGGRGKAPRLRWRVTSGRPPGAGCREGATKGARRCQTEGFTPWSQPSEPARRVVSSRCSWSAANAPRIPHGPESPVDRVEPWESATMAEQLVRPSPDRCSDSPGAGSLTIRGSQLGRW